MSIINSGAIRTLLRPGLEEVYMGAREEKTISSQIYKKKKSNRNFELTQEVAMFPLGREKPEGTEVAYESYAQTFTTTFVHRAYALGYKITKEAMEDNLYKDQFGSNTEGLKNSMMQLQEVNAFSVLNNAFDTNFPVGDGLPLISTAHILANGTTQSNGVSVAGGLNESSVQDFITQIKKMRAASGLFDNVSARRLIIPTELQYNATRLLKSQYRPATANNDIAVIPDMDLMPEGFVASKYLTSATAWFVQTDAPAGLTMYDRSPLEMDIIEDNELKALKVVAYQRYSFGVSNFRSLVGTSGTA